MRQHYYLQKLGLAAPEQLLPGDAREKRWKKERKKYGFDTRDTWNLDYTFLLWLYEHLKLFLKCTDGFVDLTYHQIKIDDCMKNLREWILECIAMLEEVLPVYDKSPKDEEIYKKTDRVMQIWSKIYPHMWW